MRTRRAIVALAVALTLTGAGSGPLRAQLSGSAEFWQSVLNVLGAKKTAKKPPKPAVHTAAPEQPAARGTRSRPESGRQSAVSDLPLQNTFLRMRTTGTDAPPVNLRRPSLDMNSREAAPIVGPLWPTGTYQGDQPALTDDENGEGDAGQNDGNRNGGSRTGTNGGTGSRNSRSIGGSSRSAVVQKISTSSRRPGGSSSSSNPLAVPPDQMCVLNPDAPDPRARAAIRTAAAQKQRYPVTYQGKKSEDVLELAKKFYERYDRRLYEVYHDGFGFIGTLIIRDPSIAFDGGKNVTWEERQAVQQLIIDNAEAFGIENPAAFSLEQCFLSVSGLPLVQVDPALVSFQMFSPDGVRRHTPPMAVMRYNEGSTTILISGHLWPRAFLPNTPSILRDDMLKSMIGTEVRYAGRAPLPCSSSRTPYEYVPCDIADPAHHVDVDVASRVEPEQVTLTTASSGQNEEGPFGNWLWYTPKKSTSTKGKAETCPLRNAEIRYVWNAGMRVPLGDGIDPLIVYYPRDAVTGDELRPIAGSIAGLPVECNRECGDDKDGSTCMIQCRSPQCGNGNVEYGWEVCDDGNNDDGDQCPGNCRPPASCGNDWCDRDWGETSENCATDCRDLVCQCEVLPKVDTNGYAWGMDALSAEDREARSLDFGERNDPEYFTARLDRWGFVDKLFIRNPDFGGGPLSSWMLRDILDTIERNADFFGIDDPGAVQWSLWNYANGAVTFDLGDIDRMAYFTMTTSDPLSPITVQKTNNGVEITGHHWPGMFIPSGYTVKQCDILKKIIGKEVHAIGRLRRVDEHRYPIPDSGDDIDITYTIHGEDVTLPPPRPVSLWFSEKNGRARVEARYVYRPHIRLRLSREFEEVRITPAFDAITGKDLKPLPKELRLPEDLQQYSGSMGTIGSIIQSPSSSSSVAPLSPEEAQPPTEEVSADDAFPDEQ